MKDIDENGVDRIERFRGYSQRFTQFSVIDEVYRETLEYMKYLRNERDAMKKQRNEAWLLINDLLEGTGDSRSNAIALLNELENRIDQLEEGLQND